MMQEAVSIGNLEVERIMAAVNPNPALMPMPRWCKKEQMSLAAPGAQSYDEPHCDEIHESLFELLKVYLQSPTAAPDDAEQGTQTTTQISISGAIPTDPRGSVNTAFGLPRVLPPPAPGSKTQEFYPCNIGLGDELDGWFPRAYGAPSTRGLPFSRKSKHAQDEALQKHEDLRLQQARDVAAAGGGLSGHTTVKIQHVPFQYTQQMLISEINRNGFHGTYDFCYLPVHAKRPGSCGTGFINFVSASAAEEFYSKYHGEKLAQCDAQITICVTPADVQGFEQSAAQYFNSWHRRKHRHQKPHSEPLFLKPVPSHLRDESWRKGRARKDEARNW